MDAPTRLRHAVSTAYAEPHLAKPIRRKPSPVPGWWFDATVIAVLVVLAVTYVIA
jgi:hypothetical protein